MYDGGRDATTSEEMSADEKRAGLDMIANLEYR